MGPAPYRGPVDRCVRCGAELGVGRFCLNCGHPIGAPAPTPEAVEPQPTAARPATDAPDATDVTAAPEAPAPAGSRALPVQAADPTPVPDVPWDPREDLLPYQEVDDLEHDAPLKGHAWIGWVVGAILLVVLVFVLLRAFGTAGADGTSADEPGAAASSPAAGGKGSASPDPKAPQGVGKKFEMASKATFDVPATAEPTTDLDGTLVAYEASQMGDGNPSTAWRMAGDATGQTVTVLLARPGVVSRVGLVNGYSKKVASVDWYPNNRRILAVTWTFDDGSTVDQTFAERPGLQQVKVPPVQTSAVKITITAVTPPGSGNLGRDYTAISEVTVVGRRAG